MLVAATNDISGREIQRVIGAAAERGRHVILAMRFETSDLDAAEQTAADPALGYGPR
jgi:hypothetical protein